jgi:hypothetical protein
MSLQFNIAKTVQKIQQTIIDGIRLKHRKLLSFGLAAYCLTPFQSAASNARRVIFNYSTAGRKSERLLANLSIADYLARQLINLSNIKPSDIVNIDHTDQAYLTALVGAVQTKRGRALPCLVDTTYANDIPSFTSEHSTHRTDALRIARLQERTQISFFEHVISALDDFRLKLGFLPKLVFDRGFMSKELVTYLINQQATFYIRIKANRLVTLKRWLVERPAAKVSSNDTIVKLYGYELRLVRSNKNRRVKEPWFILTNDMTSAKDKVVRIYYHRFEIEESFRDIKHLFELRRLKFNKPSSLRMILLLVFLGMVILYQLYQTLTWQLVVKQRHCPTNPKKVLSWVRVMYELVGLGFTGVG